MASENIIILILCLLISLETNPVSVNATCTWPPDFVDRIWTDSLKGNMDFTSTTMTGWTVSFGDQHINNWECVTYNTSGPFLAMKSNSTFLIKDNQRTGYRCLKLEKITDFSYRYYQMEPAEITFSFRRLYVSIYSSLNDTNVLCTLQPATGSEFQMMLRKGYESAAAVTCPYSLLTEYNFTYQQSDGTVSCDSVNDVGYVEMCSNVTQFNVPNLTCSPYPFYTSEDILWCVDVVVVGTDTFVSLYNGLQKASSIDETNTYHFTCVGINAEGTSMSVTPQHCKANQSPTEVPINNAGNKIGAVLSLRIDGDTCPPCPFLSNPVQGSVLTATNGTVTKATYSCEGNYTLNGNDTRVCQADGTWSGSEPSCICYVPSPPGNGTVTISDDLSEAVYTCALGFTIQGPTTRKCQSDGSGWSYMDPVCAPCPFLSNPAQGSVFTATNGTVTKATYSCDGNYTPSGNNTRVCQADGTWSGSEPSCICNAPLPPVNGTVTIPDDQSKAVYTCALGFTIQGPTTRKCQSDGSGWSYMDPVCVECPALSETGGIYTLSSNGTKTTATLTCSGGYVLVGSDTVECQSNGSWTTSANTSECVSTFEPAEGSSNGNSLLEVVIVVAILTLGLAAALGGLVFYIRKLKKTTIRAYFLNK